MKINTLYARYIQQILTVTSVTVVRQLHLCTWHNWGGLTRLVFGIRINPLICTKELIMCK